MLNRWINRDWAAHIAIRWRSLSFPWRTDWQIRRLTLVRVPKHPQRMGLRK